MHLTTEQQNEAKQILNAIATQLDGTKSAEDSKVIVEWIRNNPHFALRIATMAHAAHWFGCDCALHRIGMYWKS